VHLLAGASFASSGCASDDGVAWKVIVDRQGHTVRFLAPVAATDRATTGASPEERARAFFAKYAADLGMTDQEQLRVRDETNDSYGHQSIRFEHPARAPPTRTSTAECTRTRVSPTEPSP